MLEDHTGFIVTAYAVAFLVVAALIAWTVIDYRAQRRALAELDVNDPATRGLR